MPGKKIKKELVALNETEAPHPGHLRSLQIRTLIACMIGAGLGFGTLGIAVFGQLVQPMSVALGRTTSEVSYAFSWLALGTIIGPPVAGSLIDRFGTRNVAAVSGFALAAVFCLLSQARELWQVYALYCGAALLGSGTLVIAYSRPIVAIFDARRGAALGAMLAFIGVAVAILPTLLVQVMHVYGISGAFLFLAFLSVLSVLPAAVLLQGNAGERGNTPDKPRVSFWDAVRQIATPNGRKLLFVALLLGIFTSSVWGQAVPMLSKQGLSASDAATTMGGLAVVMTVVRLAAGIAMDRYFAPYLGAALLVPVVAGWLFLAGSPAWYMAVIAVLLFGLGLGIEFDLFSFLVSKYVPSELYASFYGLLYSCVSVGLAAGPLVASLASDLIPVARGAPLAMAFVTALAILILLRLPRYPAPEAG